MYHVVGTGLTALILYLLSYFLYRQSFFSLQFHRRFWNAILAITFLAAALAGLFLALQINYKWNIPFVKTILTWHVEFGIGLAFTGIVHFIWHISYFTGLFKRNPGQGQSNKTETVQPVHLASNLFIVGFISTSFQLLLLKEIINISGGYELIAGTFLASWLAGSSAGSAIARNSQQSDIKKINLFFAISPVISLLLMIFLSRIYLKPGETPSFLAGIIFTFVVLIPFCLISGFTFARLMAFGQQIKNSKPGKSFSIETTGGILAGIVVSILGSGKINTYELILLIILMGISYTLLTYFIKSSKERLIFKIIILIVTVMLIAFPPDSLFRQFLLRSIKVTRSVDTPYGNITSGIYDNEPSTYYNQRLISYNDDVTEREEDIHYALLQSDNPKTILLISGDAGSRMTEILKYPVSEIIYVERDPELIKTGSLKKPGSAKNLVVENEDAFTYIRKTDKRFDVIIDLLPPPSSLLINRYYTYEFFSSIKHKMNGSAIFACSPGINPDYFNMEGLKYYSSVYNTLKAVFKNVIPISGTKLYYIASDKDLSTAICSLVQQKKIVNSYVGQDYLSDDLISAKTEEVTRLLDKQAKINHNSLPVACFYYQAFDLSKDLSQKIPAVVLLFILFAIPGFAVKRKHAVMYFSAFTLAGFEIVILLMLQTAVGNMYEITGLIIAGVMSGLALGTRSEIPFLGGRSVTRVSVILIMIYLISAFASTYMISVSPGFVAVILLIVNGFLPALATGQVFRLMTSGEVLINDPAVVYSSDLLGSAAGFILFSGLAVPLFGIRNSIILLPILIVVGLLLSVTDNKR